jgi:Tfp pilus assembly protein PilO
MADRFLNLLLARLRFAAANLQVLPLLAFLLVIAAALAQLFLLPGREAAIEEAERQLASLERNARRAMIERQGERQGVHVSPEETRQRLLDRFPSENQLNSELGRLIEMATEQGLQVPSGDYRLMPGKDGLFDRYVISLPVKGNYRAIRRYVMAVRSEFPDLAIDDITLRRENIGSTEVEVQLRFVLFGRRNNA